MNVFGLCRWSGLELGLGQLETEQKRAKPRPRPNYSRPRQTETETETAVIWSRDRGPASGITSLMATRGRTVSPTAKKCWTMTKIGGGKVFTGPYETVTKFIGKARGHLELQYFTR